MPTSLTSGVSGGFGSIAGMLPDRDGCWEFSSCAGMTCFGGWTPETTQKVINIEMSFFFKSVTVNLNPAVCHVSPLGERTWAAVDRAWPCDCLDEPAVTPESSLRSLWSECCTESESVDREGEAALLWDRKKINIRRVKHPNLNREFILIIF